MYANDGILSSIPNICHLGLGTLGLIKPSWNLHGPCYEDPRSRSRCLAIQYLELCNNFERTKADSPVGLLHSSPLFYNLKLQVILIRLRLNGGLRDRRPFLRSDRPAFPPPPPPGQPTATTHSAVWRLRHTFTYGPYPINRPCAPLHIFLYRPN